MDYTLSRRDDLLIKKLSFPGLFPIGELSGTLSNGTVSGSDSSTIKWQCSFNYVGDDLQDGDTIAIYAVLDNGYEQEFDCLGTFRIFAGNISGSSIAVNGYALTKIADNTRFREPYSVSVGDDPFEHIKSILDSVGLRAAYYPSGLHSVRSATSYLPEKFSKLDIINDLLDSAGYLAADTDVYGNIIFRKSVPTPDFSSIVFEEGQASIVEDDPEIEHDWEEVCNVVLVYCENADDSVLRAVAVNDSPTDRMSTLFRGEVTRVESMRDAESQQVVDDKALSLLAEEKSKLEAVTIRHAFRPMGLFDPVDVKVGSVNGIYTVQSMDFSLDPGLITQSRVRRYIV